MMFGKRSNQRPRNDHPLLRDVQFGIERDLFSDPLGEHLLDLYEAGVRDAWSMQFIEKRVRSCEVREIKGTIAPFRRAHLQGKGILLGCNEDKQRLETSPRIFSAGTLLAGATGAAKSTFIRHLTPQLAHEGITLWISDAAKAEMRGLIRVKPFNEPNNPLIVLRHEQLRINPLEPDPGIHPRDHLNNVLDVLERSLHLPPRATEDLRIACECAFVVFNVYQGQKDRYPTLFHVFEMIRANQKLNPQSREALFSHFGSFLVDLKPSVAAWYKGWTPSQLRKHHIVFELNTAAERVKSFVLNFFLFSLLRFLVAYGKVNARLRHLVIFEDAQRYVGEPAAACAVSPLQELLAVIRSTGTSVILTVQCPSALDVPLMANLNTKIFMKLNHPADWHCMGRCLSLKPQQLEYCQIRLTAGSMVICLADGWRYPFLNFAPNVALHKPSQHELDESLQPLAGLKTIFADEFRDWRLHELIQIQTKALPANTNLQPEPLLTNLTEQSQSDPYLAGLPVELSDMEIRLLKLIEANSGLKSSELCKTLKVNGTRLVILKQNLKTQGYLEEKNLATSERGRNARILELTDKARQLLRGLNP